MARDGVSEPLTARDLLIVGLRLIGAWVFVQGYFNGMSYLDVAVFKLTEFPSSANVNPMSYVFSAAADFALAMVLAVAAPNIVDWGKSTPLDKTEDHKELA